MQRPEEFDTHLLMARHAQSKGNAGDLAQGQGDWLPNNGITDDGSAHIGSSVLAFAEAGIRVDTVTSSESQRTMESAEAFRDASIEPLPVLLPPISGVRELSKKGSEGVLTRDQDKALRKATVAQAIGILTENGLHEGLIPFVPWVIPHGTGETPFERLGDSPLKAALRGAAVLTARTGGAYELRYLHAMLNRYMDGLATATDSAQRAEVMELAQDSTHPLGSIAVIEALKDLGVPDFKTADAATNRPANASVTEYAITDSGVWIAGRRIEPIAEPAPDSPLFTVKRRSAEGLWLATAQ